MWIDFHTSLYPGRESFGRPWGNGFLVVLAHENELSVRSSDDKDTDNQTRTTVDPFLKGPQLARERKQPIKQTSRMKPALQMMYDHRQRYYNTVSMGFRSSLLRVFWRSFVIAKNSRTSIITIAAAESHRFLSILSNWAAPSSQRICSLVPPLLMTLSRLRRRSVERNAAFESSLWCYGTRR